MKAVWPLNTQFNPVNKKFYPRRRKADSMLKAEDWHKGSVKGMPRGSQPKPKTPKPCPNCIKGKLFDRKRNIWRDCVLCLKTPGEYIDKDDIQFDEK